MHMIMTKIEPAGPPVPAVSRILSRYDRQQVEAFIEIAVAMLDTLDGDPDEEPNGDDEHVIADGDTKDAAWVEWDQMRGSQKRSSNVCQQNEDYEDDDPEEEDDPAGQCDEDGMNSAQGWATKWAEGAGCPIADPGGFDDGF